MNALRFESPIHFIHYVAMSTNLYEWSFCLSIQITDQEKDKQCLYNITKSLKSYTNMLTSHASLLVEKEFLTIAILQETEVFKVKEAGANKKMTLNDDMTTLQKIHQEWDQLIKIARSLFENIFLFKVHSKWTTIIQQKCKFDWHDNR